MAASDTDFWGGAVVQDDAATNPGKGIFVYSTRVAGQIFWWAGSLTTSSTWTVGTPNPGKYIVNFADRCFIFNQVLSGAVRGRRGQWSLPGAARSWTGTGSSFREFTEFSSDITAAFALRGYLFVSSENAILIGQQTYSAFGPIRYTPVSSNGIGVYAPRSIISYDDKVAFLSQKGFMSFDGQDFTDIGGPSFNSQIMSTLNLARLETISSTWLPSPYNLLLWALPLSGASNPEYIYAYDYVNDVWHYMGSSTTFFSAINSPVYFMATSLRAPGLTWTNLAAFPPANPNQYKWNVAPIIPNRWSDYGGSVDSPNLLTGHNGGQVRRQDNSTTNPGLLLQLDTPILTFANVPVGDKKLRLEDFKELDSIEVVYYTGKDKTATSLLVFVSTDEGQTFQHFGTGTLNMSLSQISRTVRIDPISGPITGRSFIIRLTNQGTVSGSFTSYNPSFSPEDIWLRIRVKGEERDEHD